MKKDYSQVKFVNMSQILSGSCGYLGGVLAPSSHFLILTEMSMSREASLENDLSIAPVTTMDSTYFRILLI